MQQRRNFLETAGHPLFSHGEYGLSLADVASVKVGAVSGWTRSLRQRGPRQPGFRHFGHRPHRPDPPDDLVRTGRPTPRRCCPHRDALIARRIRNFDETNWWHWGRSYPQTDAPRIYVKHQDPPPQPFFSAPSTNFDGAVLGVFPHRPDVDLEAFRDALNGVDWADLGFVRDGRYLFSQRSLENALLPGRFRAFLPAPG